MKAILSILLITFNSIICLGQKNIVLKIESQNKEEDNIIQSTSYLSLHTNYNSINNTINIFEAKLNDLGYLAFTKENNKKDSITIYTYQLGPKTTTLVINTANLDSLSKKITNTETNNLTIPFQETKSRINQFLDKLEQNGYGTSVLQFINHEIYKDTLYCDLHIELSKRRTLNKIEIVSNDKIPIAIIQTSLKKEINQTYSETTISKINDKISSFNFIKTNKPTETLFTTDSTYVYLYLNKKNTNQFDGYVGFNNDEDGKLKLNGYLDLKLNNILNRAELFELLWKNNGKKQSDFNFKAEIPYLFKTSIALKGSFEIQKQDSTYQNTELELGLGYYLNHQNKIFLGYQTTNSATNEESPILKNYDSKYFTINYEYSQLNKQRTLFPIDHQIYLKLGTGKRNSETDNNNQSFIEFIVSKNFEVTPTNLFYIKWNTYFLLSDNYYFNELKRFGGTQTLRGFQENSLAAKAFSIINTEYRIQISSNLSFNSILDYAYIKDPQSEQFNHLYSFGFGMGILTKNSHFKLAFANGKTPKEKMSFENTTIHISMSTFF